MTATEASRNFSELLDAIERGETATITRGHHAVAEIMPARRRTGADLRAAFERITPPDDRFATDIAGALALISSEGEDPWAGAAARGDGRRVDGVAAVSGRMFIRQIPFDLRRRP